MGETNNVPNGHSTPPPNGATGGAKAEGDRAQAEIAALRAKVAEIDERQKEKLKKKPPVRRRRLCSCQSCQSCAGSRTGRTGASPWDGAAA